MSKHQVMTLAIEPSLIFDQTADAFAQQNADRLREYVNLDLLSIVFVSKDDEPLQLVQEIRQYGFRCLPRVFNPDSDKTTVWQDDRWAVEEDPLEPSKVVFVVSSSLSASAASL